MGDRVHIAYLVRFVVIHCIREKRMWIKMGIKLRAVSLMKRKYG